MDRSNTRAHFRLEYSSDYRHDEGEHYHLSSIVLADGPIPNFFAGKHALTSNTTNDLLEFIFSFRASGLSAARNILEQKHQAYFEKLIRLCQEAGHFTPKIREDFFIES